MKCVAILSLALAISFATDTLAQTGDYCARSLCNGAPHIACRNNGAFGTACPRGVAQVNMNPLKARIVGAHNLHRNRVAGGGLPRFRPAVRMATMQWDTELENLACLNVKRCVFGHDQCRNTNRFHFSGQNLATNSWSGMRRSDASVIIGQIERWFAENVDASMAQINSYSNPTNGRQIGHFTVMVADKNTHLGCCSVKYLRNRSTNLLTACNYAMTNVLNRPIYVSGARAATQCTTGTNRNYRNLCSIREAIDVNNP